METRTKIASTLGDVETERLLLRRFHERDLDALQVVFAKPEVWKFPFGRGMTREETKTFLSAQLDSWATNGFGCWLASERHSLRVIGYLGLSIPSSSQRSCRRLRLGGGSILESGAGATPLKVLPWP